ncbi:hypothetical protein Tco_0482290, partial [Tanacetum coccineum]
MAPETATAEPQLFLEKPELGVTGTIILMFCRMWDVYAATGRYLSTDFVVCDSKGSTMHATARGSVAHNFLKLKEGGIYSPDGFIRFLFQFVDFDHLEATINKYLIDAAGYVTNVGRTVQQKIGSKTLDFHLANSSAGYPVRIPWGVVDRKKNQPCWGVSDYSNVPDSRLYLSSTPSTLILDDEEILEVKQLKADSSGAEFSKEIPPVGCSEAKSGTLENLLMWSRNQKHDSATFHCTMRIDNVKTKKGWNFPSCEGDKHSPLPQALANIVGASHTLEFKSHTYYEYNTYESFTCWRIVTAEGMGESGGSSMAGGSRAFETSEFKRLLRHPSVTTSSKIDEGKKQKRGEDKASDAEASFVADTQIGSGVGGSRPNTRKNK